MIDAGITGAQDGRRLVSGTLLRVQPRVWQYWYLARTCGYELLEDIPDDKLSNRFRMAHQAAPIRRIIFGTNLSPNAITRNSPKVNASPRIESMLAHPSWSVKSLLPSPDSTETGQISKEKLHHLLKLSALPLPKSGLEEQRMLKTLESQIHFVKEVQKVDTTGVEPLVAIRDETAEAIAEQTIGLETLRPYLDKEIKVGGNGTLRRQKQAEMIKDSGWNPFEMGKGKDTRKKGRFFYVRKRNNLPAVGSQLH